MRGFALTVSEIGERVGGFVGGLVDGNPPTPFK